jgi:hypothetical protein
VVQHFFHQVSNVARDPFSIATRSLGSILCVYSCMTSHF